MTTLLQVEFKYRGLFAQASTEPKLKGVWRGALGGPSEQRYTIETIATAQHFDPPYQFGKSVWSPFTITNTEPLAVIDELLAKMRPHFPDFPTVPYDLWFSVFNDTILTIRFADEDQQVVEVAPYNPIRGRNEAFAARAKALPEVDDTVSLHEGKTYVVLTQRADTAADFVAVGAKLAAAFERRVS